MPRVARRWTNEMMRSRAHSARPPRLLSLFSDLVDAAPDAIVLYDADAGHSEARPVTRSELGDLAAIIACELREHRISVGDCIGVWLPNWSHAVAAQLAALAVGAHVIGINTRYNSEELAHVLQMARPRVVILAHDFHNLDLLGTLRSALAAPGTTAPMVLAVSRPGALAPKDVSVYDVGAGAGSFPQAASNAGLEPCPAPSLAVAFTTSGSTGTPKLPAHSEMGVCEHSIAVGREIGLRPGDVMLGILPLSGVLGFNVSMAAILAGASVLLEPV